MIFISNECSHNHLFYFVKDIKLRNGIINHTNTIYLICSGKRKYHGAIDKLLNWNVDTVPVSDLIIIINPFGITTDLWWTNIIGVLIWDFFDKAENNFHVEHFQTWRILSKKLFWIGLKHLFYKLRYFISSLSLSSFLPFFLLFFCISFHLNQLET